jgi:dihydrofolate synthase/folylpolyglutamate synthase
MALHPKGFDLSLGRITRLLERLGNPHERLPPVIHIAGTNGKGSRAHSAARFWKPTVSGSTFIPRRIWSIGTSATGSAQQAAGGLWPTMCWPMRCAGSPRPISGEMITVFEILTAVMFVLFSEHPADVAIIEVGLGGRFDATNVIAKPGRGADHVDFARSSGLSWRPGGADRGGEGRDHQGRGFRW